MNKTNLSRCSKLALVALLVVVSVAAPATAVSVGDRSIPAEAAVGSQITASVTLTELYTDPQLEQWSLAGETDLRDVTWTVTYYDQTDAKVNQQSFDGENFSGAVVSADEGTSRVEVRITGTVPEIRQYTYEPPQSFVVMDLDQAREGGSSNDLGTWESHHYTAESREAREAIDEAQAAIDSASADTSEAEATLDNAISAYDGEGGSFDVATNLAEEAQTEAEEAEQSSRTMRLVLYGVGGLLVVGLLTGGILWYRSQQDSHDKLG